MGGTRAASSDGLRAGGGLKACTDAGRVVLFAPPRVSLRSGHLSLLRGVPRVLAQAGMRDIILDLSGCRYVDSAGVGELVSAFTFCTNGGGSFPLNRLPPKIHDLLQVTKLYTVFSYANVDYSSHPTFDVSPEDISAARAAHAAPGAGLISLFLTAREGRIQLFPGRVPGLYKVSLSTSPGREWIVGAPFVIADVTRSYLQQEIEEFEYLVNSPTCAEGDIQRFLESHPKFLLGQEYERLYPHVILEREGKGPLIPDFLLQPFGKRFCDIVDLKLPETQPIVGKTDRKRFSSAIAEASAQLRTYRDYFEDAKQRESVLKRLGITAYRPRLAVVVGNKVEIEDEILLKQIEDGTPGIEVITYDALLTRAKKFLLS
jgi:anti-sigma B factor antagonist